MKDIKMRREDPVCFLQLHRPESGNAISPTMIEECTEVLELCRAETITTVVVEGIPDVFCVGADFGAAAQEMAAGRTQSEAASPLYRLWLQLARGPFVSIACVRGKATAGGVGFAAACDIVLASPSASFGLSEMLFGLFPACVLPFLERRVGGQHAHYLTLMTKTVAASEAHRMGLVDAIDEDVDRLLRTHLRRLRCLSKSAITQYKDYIRRLPGELEAAMGPAVEANQRMFSDPGVQGGIRRYVETGCFPWET